MQTARKWAGRGLMGIGATCCVGTVALVAAFKQVCGCITTLFTNKYIDLYDILYFTFHFIDLPTLVAWLGFVNFNPAL